VSAFNNNNNKVIYTTQIHLGRKFAFSRHYWRGKFSISLEICRVTSDECSTTGRLF